MPFSFDNTYARLPERFFARVEPTRVVAPRLLAINEALATLLGLSSDDLESPDLVEYLAGNRLPPGAEPIASAYAGHQFASFVPQLGDGRAVLLGEIIGTDARRYDVQLKGAGPTPFSRRGDGRAALGPVLREYVVSEAMVALGVPTTRALSAVLTGERVHRETSLPGAVLTRVASSHLRVGTFQYFAARQDIEALRILTSHALARHYPEAQSTDGPALALLEAVISAQARLVARWLGIGFVHGVMNTDNTSIAGETIDYGPCAFLDAFDPKRSFSSIDHNGRYAFDAQPRIALWNLARLGEALLPLVAEDEARAVALVTERLEAFPTQFEAAYTTEFRHKLGLSTPEEGDRGLATGWLELLAQDRVDYTLAFRQLESALTTEDATPLATLFRDAVPVTTWFKTWRERLARDGVLTESTRQLLRRSNPAFIPRNHRIEEMIAAATAGDLLPFERLLRVLGRPYDEQPDHAELMEPPGEEQWSYQTFCGT